MLRNPRKFDRRPIKYAWAASLSAAMGMIVISQGVEAARWAPVLNAVLQVIQQSDSQQQRQAQVIGEALRACEPSGTSR